MSSVKSTSGNVDVDLATLFSGLFRNWLRIVLVAVTVATTVFVLAFLATPYYHAETRVTIERTESPIPRKADSVSDYRLFDQEGINTQIEILTSTDLLKRVANKLDLADDPEFDDTKSPSLIRRLLIMTGLKGNPADIASEERVLTKFRERLRVYRSEKTRTIVIGFSSESPKLAAEVPQYIAKTYVEFSLAAKQEPNRMAIQSLEPEIKAQTSRVKAAEAKVADFRAKSGLIAEPGTSAPAALNRPEAASPGVDDSAVQLRSLERAAAGAREQLGSYISRLREAQSRGTHEYLPVDALTISDSVVPSEPYFPKVWPITGAALAASLLLTSIGILLRGLFSSRAMRPAHGSYFEPVEQVHMPVFEPVVERRSKPQTEPGRRAEFAEDAEFAEIPARAAAEMLIAGDTTRALFVSPEGDEAPAIVARDVADAGLRVLLVDLTTIGAASTPMLDGASLPGITDLLAGTARFTDVIHADHYSDCHVIPVGNADRQKAMRAVERLPIIMNTLNAAYDVVIVACDPAGADNIRRLVSEGSEVLVSVIAPDEAVLAARDDPASGGYEGLTPVTRADYAPYPDRTAA